MGVLVEMSEEECARRWLAKNNLMAVSWGVINALVERQINNPIVAFDPQNNTYVLSPHPTSTAPLQGRLVS